MCPPQGWATAPWHPGHLHPGLGKYLSYDNPQRDGNYQDMDIMAWNIAGSEPWAFRSLYFQYTTLLKGQEVTTPLHHSQLMVNYRTRASSSILSPFRDTFNLRISPGPQHNRYGEIRIRIFSWGNKGTQKECQIRKKIHEKGIKN